MKEYQAFSKQKKKEVRNTGYIIAIVILSLLLLGSNLVMYFGVYAKLNMLSKKPSMSLGEAITVNLEENKASASQLLFGGVTLQSVKKLSKVSGKLSLTTGPVLLRARYYVTNASGATLPAKAVIDSNWVRGNDDYYYYIFKLNLGEKITLANGFVLPKFNSEQNDIYSLTILCETLSENFDYASLWDTAPSQWLSEL